MLQGGKIKRVGFFVQNKSSKLTLLLEVFSRIQMNMTDNQYTIDNFIENAGKISEEINSNFWNGGRIS